MLKTHEKIIGIGALILLFGSFYALKNAVKKDQ